VDIDFAGHCVTGLNFAGTSKAGHMSWTGSVSDGPVKLYETPTPTTAALVSYVSNDASVGSFFPPVLATMSRFVLARWVSGKPLSPNSDAARHAGRLLAALHRVNPSGQSGFDYAKYLEQRFIEWAGPFLESHFRPVLDEGVEALASISANAPRLSHPDVTYRNLVVDDRLGRPVVVDNELLGVGPWYPLDVLNSLASLRTVGNAANSLLAGYSAAGGDVSVLADARDELIAAWRLRVISSLLRAGNLRDAIDATNSAGLDDQVLRLLEMISKR
jgi:aminoglycoside phosphotransferase (APT) family kinase protein